MAASTHSSDRVEILCAFEDRAYEDIVVPLMRRVATEERVDLGIVGVEIVHGCRFRRLERILRDRRQAQSLWLIGADAGDRRVDRKEAAMRQRLGRSLQGRQVLFAIASPSAEGWMQGDLAALKQGVSEALDTEVTLPAEIPLYPDSEALAKQRLGSILGAAGVPALRQGLEYGGHVMARVAYDAEPSFEGFVRNWRRFLRTGRV